MLSSRASVAVCLLFVAVATEVNGKYIRSRRHDFDGKTCDEGIFTCISEFGIAYSDDTLLDNIVSQGLNEVCPPFITAKNCFEAALRNCDDSSPFRETLGLLVEIIRFGCEMEVRVLNENRACLFGEPMRTALNAQCPNHGLGHICSLTANNECAFQLIETRCENAALANKIRAFTKKIQKSVGCRTARSVREVLEEMLSR